MRAQQVNRVCGRLSVMLSAVALVSALSGYIWRPGADEGSAAHIFQLAIVALGPILLTYVVTADWRKGRCRSARPLVVAIAVPALSFMALYRLEHGL
ncbi:MAG: hypothetical protein H0X25_10965 [Acidobacteriales bacterium]|nr:hypothetical protein [Terriglobales bacterium]